MGRIHVCPAAGVLTSSDGPDNGTGSTGADMARLGGLEVLPETLSTSTSTSSSSDAESSMAIVYIGDKVEQLDSVALQTGQVSILHYSNLEGAPCGVRTRALFGRGSGGWPVWSSPRSSV